jgi:glycosyltransferase domain-containing protein
MLRSVLRSLRRGTAPPAPQSGADTRSPLKQSRFADRLSIIVPSVADRARFFDTALGHFATCAVRWPIVVSDHSATEQASVLAGVAARHPGLDLRMLRHPPAMHFLERLAACAEAAQTDYVVLHADDDFMIPAAMESCIAFLDANPDFAACMGRMAWFRAAALDKTQVNTIDGRTRAEEDAAERLINHVANFNPTLYAIHRREVFVESCVRTLDFTRNVIFWQYLQSCIAVLRGKLKTLDGLYYLRLHNDVGWRAQLIARRDSSHWPHIAVSPEFSAELGRFKNGLHALLGGAEPDRSARIDDACIWLIRRGLCEKTRDPDEAWAAGFLARLLAAGSEEHELLQYAVQCVRRAQEPALAAP